MTDRPARRPRRPGLGAVAQASLAAFAIVLALLVLQLRAGRDPALGPGRRAAAAAVAAAPRRVLVRRVVVTRVVVRQVEDPGEDGGGGQPVTRTVLVPQVTTSAPAPAPAAAAPAPAPAPLVTKTS